MNTESGVQNPNVLDMITYDPKSDEAVLVMIETREWDGSRERMSQILEKTNRYLDYALHGGLERQYPDMKGKAVRLRLDCLAPPDAETEKYIEKLRSAIAPLGMKFVVELL